MKNVSVNVDQMQLFVILKKDGIKINVDVYVIKDLFGILVIGSVNVIKLVILGNIQTLKIVNAEKISR